MQNCSPSELQSLKQKIFFLAILSASICGNRLSARWNIALNIIKIPFQRIQTILWEGSFEHQYVIRRTSLAALTFSLGNILGTYLFHRSKSIPRLVQHKHTVKFQAPSFTICMLQVYISFVVNFFDHRLK